MNVILPQLLLDLLITTKKSSNWDGWKQWMSKETKKTGVKRKRDRTMFRQDRLRPYRLCKQTNYLKITGHFSWTISFLKTCRRIHLNRAAGTSTGEVMKDISHMLVLTTKNINWWIKSHRCSMLRMLQRQQWPIHFILRTCAWSKFSSRNINRPIHSLYSKCSEIISHNHFLTVLRCNITLKNHNNNAVVYPI